MSKTVLVDARLFVGGVDLSGQSNKIEFTTEHEEREVTNWRSGGAKEVIAGLEQVDLTAEGYWEAGDPGKVDDAVWANRRVVEPWTIAADGQSDVSVGGRMYLVNAVRTSTTLFDEVGAVAPWSLTAKGTGPAVQGRCLHPSGVPRTATGVGTAYQVGEVGTGQKLYANLHVLSAAGTSPTLVVAVESSATEDFASSTSRGTFEQKTTTGEYEHLEITGPFTDEPWLRVSYTVGGTSPSFLFLVSVGIL